MSDLHIYNSSVCDFYKKHKNINFQNVNLWFVKLFENIICEDSENSVVQIEKIINQPIHTTLTDILPTAYLQKGQNGEKKLEMILNKLDETSQIIDGQTRKICGDFQIVRVGKPTIFIESKETCSNIAFEIVEKFMKNSKESSFCGILMSQHSGIINKPNFLIDVCNGSILIYMHNVEYDPIKIKTAIDIIDKLYIKLQDFNSDINKGMINNEIIEEINKEYQLFTSKKECIINFIKENQKKLLGQIEDLNFNNLDEYLCSKYKPIQQLVTTHKCIMCNIYSAKSLKALAAHKRGCKKKNFGAPSEDITLTV